jgi:thiamine-phosphate pyrophosphorylase
MKPDWRVYLVTDPLLIGNRPLSEVVAAALRGGVGLVQVRDKTADDQGIVACARALLPICRAHAVPLLINDRIDLAVAAGADGVHLGQDDGNPAEARQTLGSDAIIGVSIDRPEECPPSCDYVGLGPIFPTGTKNDTGPVVGIDGLRRMRPQIPLPVIAIGGITEERCPATIAAGADGVAVVSSICAADDPEAAARNLYRAATDGETR